MEYIVIYNSYNNYIVISLSYPERLRDRPYEVSATDSRMNTVPIPTSIICLKDENEMVRIYLRAYCFLSGKGAIGSFRSIKKVDDINCLLRNSHLSIAHLRENLIIHSHLSTVISFVTHL